jgi:hypothetical protein
VAPAPTLFAEDVVPAGAALLGDLFDGRAGAVRSWLVRREGSRDCKGYNGSKCSNDDANVSLRRAPGGSVDDGR